MGENNLYGAPWTGYTNTGIPIDWNRMSVPIALPTINALRMSGALDGPKMKGNPLDIDTNVPKKSKFKIADPAALASSGIAFAGDLYNNFLYDRTADDFAQEAGSVSTTTGNGVGYELQRVLDTEGELKRTRNESRANTLKSAASGAALGTAVMPGIGTAIGAGLGFLGGIFGGHSRKKAMQRALFEHLNKVMRTNAFNTDVAMTKGMQMDFNQQYGNLSNLLLFAKHGKDSNMKEKSFGIGVVDTPFGPQYGEMNAVAHHGEPMQEPISGYASTVKGGTGNGENAPVNVTDSTIIYGGDVDPTNGMTYEHQAYPLVKMRELIQNKLDRNKTNKAKELANRVAAPILNKIDDELNAIGERLAAYRLLDYTGIGTPKYAKGKIGWTSNFVPSVLGLGASLYQYADARRQPIYRPNTFVANPYEQRALAELDSLRVNPYPMEREMRNAESRMNYAMNNSGGLSGAQKYLGRIANYNNLYNSIANMYSGIQQQNNAYRAAAANAKLETGAKYATDRMAARRADDEVYMKSHAARQGGMQTGLFNFMNYLQNYAKSENQRRMYNGMYDLYALDREIEKEKLKKGLKG